MFELLSCRPADNYSGRIGAAVGTESKGVFVRRSGFSRSDAGSEECQLAEVPAIKGSLYHTVIYNLAQIGRLGLQERNATDGNFLTTSPISS